MDITSYLNPSTLEKLRDWGYVLALCLMVPEGPIVTFAAGFLASIGVFSFPVVLLLGWIGDFLGDSLYFAIGRSGKRIFRQKQENRERENSEFLRKLDRLVAANPFLSVFVSKFTPFIQPVALTYIGHSRISSRDYFLSSFVLCVPIPFVFAISGYYVGQINAFFQNSKDKKILFSLVSAVVIVAVCAALVLYLRKKSRNVLEAKAAEGKL